MNKQNIDKSILKKAQSWLDGNYDITTKKQVKNLLENNINELNDAFYKDLEFGTGGLRGIMGVGTNRMNKYTVGIATQGLANYLKKIYTDKKQIKIAIAYDCRNNSAFFARTAADVLAANKFKVYLFDELRPTPELSFAVRYLKCNAGIVITASHNPKEYNGYKVYWNDGGQLVPPHYKNIIEQVEKIKNINDVNFNGKSKYIEIIGKNIDDKYLKRIKELSLSKNIIKKHKYLKIVYTSIHGTGIKLVPQSLKNFGFRDVYIVDKQCIVDGNFSTVKSPNPEEPEALSLAIKRAKQVDADLVMATDPDGDRVGIAVKNYENKFVLLNGNQIASLLIYYLINKWKNDRKLKGKEYIVKTIVTTELLKDIADKNNVECFDVLTGFKYIAEVIKQNEDKKTFIGGGEESYGYLMGDFVRDKDAVISCSMIAETCAWAIHKDKTLYDLLADIYFEYGFYKERLMYIVKKGKSGSEKIQEMMKNYRDNPMLSINNSDVVVIKDYLTQTEKNFVDGTEKPLKKLLKSNVIQFFLKDKTKITVRPSGTEPKIKYYFSVKTNLEDKARFEETNKILEKRIDDVISSMGLR